MDAAQSVSDTRTVTNRKRTNRKTESVHGTISNSKDNNDNNFASVHGRVDERATVRHGDQADHVGPRGLVGQLQEHPAVDQADASRDQHRNSSRSAAEIRLYVGLAFANPKRKLICFG